MTKTDTDPRPLLNAAGLWAEQCLFNRGIVLVDTAAWKAQHVTEEIEQWMVWDHYATQAFGYGGQRSVEHQARWMYSLVVCAIAAHV